MPRKKAPLKIQVTIIEPHVIRQGDYVTITGVDSKTGRLVQINEYKPKGDEQ
jgi:hypothetical protein